MNPIISRLGGISVMLDTVPERKKVSSYTSLVVRTLAAQVHSELDLYLSPFGTAEIPRYTSEEIANIHTYLKTVRNRYSTLKEGGAFPTCLWMSNKTERAISHLITRITSIFPEPSVPVVI